jgi:hypothetical protein
VLRKTPEAAEKVFTICDYAGTAGEIDDPMPRATEEAYERCAEQLAGLMRSLTLRLRGV